MAALVVGHGMGEILGGGSGSDVGLVGDVRKCDEVVGAVSGTGRVCDWLSATAP